MAKKKLAPAAPFQLLYEKILGIAAVVLIFFHMFLSFARHFFAPENRMGESPAVLKMLQADKWFALMLLIAFIAYLMITKLRFPQTWYRIADAFKRCVCMEFITLFIVFVCFVFACVDQSQRYADIFKASDLYLLDAFICCVVLLPMANLVGYQKMRKILEIVLHGIMLLTTAFIVWALWNLFRLNLVRLPNGLRIGMTEDYTFYAGVNENIAAAIGTTMIMIALYMAVSHGGIIRILYSICILPHLLATLLTDSRANFVALLAALPLIAFMLVWKHKKIEKTIVRAALACAAALAVGAVIWWLRSGVFDLFESVTHFSEKAGIARASQSLTKDSGRFGIWSATVRIIFSSPQTFFFGVPLGLIPQKIQEALIELYGKGNLMAHAHNMILQTALVTGVPGMIAFVAFLVRLAIRCVRVGIMKTAEGVPGAFILPVAILAFVIVNMFEPFLLFYLSVMGCVFFLFSGWITAIDRGNA